MTIKEIEQNIEQKIIGGIGALTDIINYIDDEKLTSNEKVKSIKNTIDYLFKDFNRTFKMHKNNRNLVFNGDPELVSDIEELKTSMVEYIMKNNEQTLRYNTKDIDDVFKDFE